MTYFFILSDILAVACFVVFIVVGVLEGAQSNRHGNLNFWRGSFLALILLVLAVQSGHRGADIVNAVWTLSR